MFERRGSLSLFISVVLLTSLVWLPVAQAQSRIPRGTDIKLILNNGISTKTANQGDKFTATVAENVVEGGRIMIREGATLHGTVTKVERAKRLAGLTGKASLILRFDNVRTVEGIRPISATLISVHDPVASENKQKVGDEGEIKSKTETKDILKKGGIGVAAGAVLGALFGNVSRGLLLGTIGGAAAILAPKGREVELPEGTGLRINLNRDVNMSIT